MATPTVLYGANGQPFTSFAAPYGEILLTATPPRVYGVFKAATNSGEQTQTVVNCPSGLAIYITDIVISANKTNGSTVTVRFYDGTNTENIMVADSSEGTVNLAMHPAGRTLGWDGAYVQLVTDTGGQAATLTVWYNRVFGKNMVQSYSVWNSLRG